ncbi:hypothetical protein D8674_019260 [Pyrus ussuriensis x Pyrus communis]|uniref:Uncharacterized protein n=1 Tax=Pyrus ussuriensis x Pyrus communis TaxID=2448454 RepID=A0A5N5G7I5_9ROSA|nr:hypothetical protein D8674_019260 [Pyrus ussuriensis x Pyrus communis]
MADMALLDLFPRSVVITFPSGSRKHSPLPAPKPENHEILKFSCRITVEDDSCAAKGKAAVEFIGSGRFVAAIL